MWNIGIKDRTNLYVLKYIMMPAVLIECAFVDSRNDMDRYNYVEIAEVIANYIIRVVGSGNNNQSNINESSYTVNKGNTLCRIVRKYRTIVWAITRMNNINNVNLIIVGQKIRIY